MEKTQTSRLMVDRLSRAVHPTARAAPEITTDQSRVVARSIAAMGLIGVALIHLLDSVGKYTETRYIFWMYVALITGAVISAMYLVDRDSGLAWLAAGSLAGLTMIGYAMSRTTGLPASTGDIGNWTEPLGLASLFVEGCIVLLSAYRLSILERRLKAGI